ncbi:MAG: DegT/DnrJ/EryC1/StrS family aminotransferase [Alphaproteobacteria bacterium]|nr:DegT/DnrJ/EryC1/StrS family aminotransferase [Alphaproteobacteria bacterium]
MTNKPSKSICLFDIPSNQKAIGQENFLNAFEKILNHGGYAQGPECAELDTKLASYSGTKHCATCSSGTDALILALMAWEVKAGDAVFVPSFTFVATAEAVAFLGATPVFVDSNTETWNMDVADLKKAIAEVKAQGKLTPKAIISVDIFGNPANYSEIHAVAKENNMKYLSDAAQSYGAVYEGKKVGHSTLADMTATSFYPTKPLGCYGDGGAVFCNTDEELALVKSCRVHGSSTEDKYDNVRLGLTARMDSFQAAVVMQKLTVFDDELKNREKIGKYYSANLDSSFKTQKVLNNCVSAYAIYTILADNKAELQDWLKECGIPFANFYPRPVHTQTAYKSYNTRSLPVCESMASKVLSLPMHPYLTTEEQDYIISCLNSFAQKTKAA